MNQENLLSLRSAVEKAFQEAGVNIYEQAPRLLRLIDENRPHVEASCSPEGLTRFLDDGRIEIDSNVVERAIRPIALNRKNKLFAGSDGGGQHWAVIASLIETCKLTGIEPHAYLTYIITKIVNGHPNSQIDDLLPWAYPIAPALRDVA